MDQSPKKKKKKWKFLTIFATCIFHSRKCLKHEILHLFKSDAPISIYVDLREYQAKLTVCFTLSRERLERKGSLDLWFSSACRHFNLYSFNVGQ